MTKKHFVLFAKMLTEIDDETQRADFADRLIQVFKDSNERFDEARFRTAANVTETMPY